MLGVATRKGEAMSKLRLQIEIGPKGKRVAAVACDWPGLSRGGKTAEQAIDTVVAYIPRYAPVADLAGLSAEFANVSGAEVVEEYTGPGSTDFWAISFGFGTHDRAAMTDTELDRELGLLQAAWTYFDQVRGRVSAEMKKGPRGGGRDRDVIVRHVVGNEWDWKGGLGIKVPWEGMPSDEGLVQHRADYVAGIRQFHAEGKYAKKWPLRYMIRHTAFHTLDHAWEMEDKDLTGDSPTA
jgi:hypothetical protein